MVSLFRNIVVKFIRISTNYAQSQTIDSSILNHVKIVDNTNSPRISDSAFFNRDISLNPRFEYYDAQFASKNSTKVLQNDFSRTESLSSSAATDPGRTESTLDVSAAGGANFSIPFKLPPGIGKVVPQLGLNFDSQAGNGIAGNGWNITGLSSITRIQATTYHDNRKGGVNLDKNDRFALDGQRLLLKSGTYGADGAEYQTEIFSNVRIISRGVSPYGAEYGPEYFEIRYPDGSSAYYGRTNNSRTPFDYALTYTQNILNVRISYTYTQSNNVLYVTSVGYGSVGTSLPINTVNFSYATASRAEQAYIGGLPVFRDKILTKIVIVSNGINYRQYKLTYGSMGSLNYQRLNAIQEMNGNESKAFEPIYFDYGLTNDVVTSSTISNLSLSGIAANNSQVVTADFTGNGSMDFLVYPNNKSKFWVFYDLDQGSPYLQLGYEINSGTFRDIFPTTWLTQNGKLLSGQGIGLIKSVGNNSYKFTVYSAGTASPVYYQYEKNWSNVPLGIGYYSNCDNAYHSGSPLNMDFVTGDFNGDGLTDVISVAKSGNVVVGEQWSDPSNPPNPPNPTIQAESSSKQVPPGSNTCIKQYGDSGSPSFFINLDTRLTSDYVFNSGNFYPYYSNGDKLLTGDVNGDGKTDIIHIKNGLMNVYSLNENNTLIKLWQHTDSRISTTQSALMGDYNGDGKTDIMFSTGYNSMFATFISKGNGFIKHEQNQPFANSEGNWNGAPGVEELNLFYLIPNDVNGDGKTDIIKAQTITWNNNTNGKSRVTLHHNLGTGNTGAPSFSAGLQSERNSNLKHYPIPIFINPNRLNPNLEFGFISDNGIILYKFNKDYRKDNQLNIVRQDGIFHTLDYKELINGTYNSDLSVYQNEYNQTYPFISHFNIPGYNVVAKITRTFGSEQISQSFSYFNAVSHASGLGFIGFEELIRSSWSTGSGDVSRTYDISVNDMSLRGANVRNFKTKTPYINPNIKSIALQSASNSNAINDGASISDYLYRSDQEYNSVLLTNKVFINNPIAMATKDMLTNTFISKSVTYDGFNNPTKIIENINGTLTKTSEISYASNSSAVAGYYVGRVIQNKTTSSTNGDVFSTQTDFTYSGYAPSRIRKKGYNTTYNTEDFTYDTFGNVVKTVFTNPQGGQRVAKMEYDPSGRFLTKLTDIEGNVSVYSVNLDNGTLISKTNKFGHIDNFSYDTWGREQSITDHLGNQTVRQYQKSGSNIEISDTDNEGRFKKVTINALGYTIESRSKTILGQIIGKSWRFDVYGRQIAESIPAIPGSNQSWNVNVYDELGRIKQVIEFNGKTSNFSYTGLTTTVNEGARTKVITKNALGQTISLQDPGGTINYMYFANGGLKEVKFGDIITTIEQDGWGRKTKLNDPTAGSFTYEYNGFNQVTKEISPNGTTSYSYDLMGKMMSKSVVGNQTNIQMSFSYDAITGLLNGSSVINADGNNSTYTYTYDNYQRLVGRIEDNIHARFETNYAYDTYGRSASETYKVKNKSNNFILEKTVENTFQNGQLLQRTLQGSNSVLWKITDLDNSGRLSGFAQGSNEKTSISFDSFGLPEQSKLDKITPSQTLMILGYNFDAQQGNLNSRTNSALAWSETFTHDNLNRLTGFNSNNTNSTQSYDGYGRISNNSEVGDYIYDAGSFKQTELVNLVPAMDTYYQSRQVQDISFNAFKKPVEIIEQGGERLSFEYNVNLQRSHMYFGSAENDKLLRRYRKHYAEDGSAEIISDSQTGKTSIILYLGGDAYDATAIWKETLQNGATSGSLYYLHRDHLGSIVMITNTSGIVVEKRQFDAWGKIVKLTDGNGNLIAFSSMIIDRGFTGHEHIMGGALINMNGRLYDPRIHRFLSPDNFVQDAFNTQNQNRYAYAMNNPLVYNDTNGEFLHLVVGALVGGLVNWVAHGAHFNWKGLAYFGTGALAGAIGAGVGSGISSSIVGGSFGAGFVGSSSQTAVTSFLSGAVVGAGGGAAGGFTSGFGNAIVDGQSFRSALTSGFRSGGWGALGGGVVGGISGGIDALFDGRDFWTGGMEPKVHALSLTGTEVNNGSSYVSQDDMVSDYNSNIGVDQSLDEVEKVIRTEVNLATDNTIPAGYELTKSGYLHNVSQGPNSLSGGITIERTTEGLFRSKTFDIYISPAVKGLDRELKNMVFKHEFIHGWHHANFSPTLASRYTENIASSYSLVYVKGIASLQYLANTYRTLVGAGPSNMQWRVFNKIVPLWLK